MKKVLGVLLVITVVLYVIKSGEFAPDNAIVCLDKDTMTYFPEYACTTVAITTTIREAKSYGYKPSSKSSFAVEGPSVLVLMLEHVGNFQVPRYWSGTNHVVRIK